MQLSVSDPPENITTTTPEVTVIVAEMVRFECTVGGGNPHIYTFNWTRTGDVDFRNITDTETLEFEVASVEQEDTYYCTPKNTAGPGETVDMSLTVNSE